MTQTPPQQPEPDTKDWSFTTTRPCDECGYDPTAVADTDLAEALRATVSRWNAVLAGADARLAALSGPKLQRVGRAVRPEHHPDRQAQAGPGVGHLAVAADVRAALECLRAAEATDGPIDTLPLLRARKLMHYFGQPFFCAEPYTKRPGTYVPLAEALRACREILDGAHDDLAVEAFRFEGSIEDIRAKAARG